MTLAEFLDQHDSDELAELEALDRIEPFGLQTRMLANLCSIVWNSTPGREEPLTPDNFLGVLTEEPEQDPAETRRLFREAVARLTNVNDCDP